MEDQEQPPKPTRGITEEVDNLLERARQQGVPPEELKLSFKEVGGEIVAHTAKRKDKYIFAAGIGLTALGFYSERKPRRKRKK